MLENKESVYMTTIQVSDDHLDSSMPEFLLRQYLEGSCSIMLTERALRNIQTFYHLSPFSISKHSLSP